MSSVKLRLLAGGGSSDHGSEGRPPRRQYREGNVFYPFGVAPADSKRPLGQGGDEPADWLQGGWDGFLEKIGLLERLRRDPEEWNPGFEPPSPSRGRPPTS